MAFLFESDVHKLRFISSHVLGTTIVQVPQLHGFHHISLQKTNSSTKIWSPYKNGSFCITFITGNFRVFGNLSHNTFRNRIFPNFTESNRVTSLHAIKACNNRLFRFFNRLFFWKFWKIVWKLILLALWIKACTALVVGSDDVAPSYGIGVLTRRQVGRREGSRGAREVASY